MKMDEAVEDRMLEIRIKFLVTKLPSVPKMTCHIFDSKMVHPILRL